MDIYSTMQLKLVVKTKFSFISLLFSLPVSQGSSGKIRWKAFNFFSLVFPDVKYISPLGKSNSSDFSSGYRENW